MKQLNTITNNPTPSAPKASPAEPRALEKPVLADRNRVSDHQLQSGAGAIATGLSRSFPVTPQQQGIKNMAFLNNFDASSVDPATSFDPIPDGKYVAAITDSEMKPTKSGTGHYLEMTFDILDGQYKGRKVWARLNLDNPNATTVEIARSELSAICRSVGVMQPQDSAELHGLPLRIKVGCKRRDDTGEMINEVKGYEKREAELSSAPTLPPAVLVAHAASTPPWQG